MDKTKQAVAIFNKQAKVYQDRFMNQELYKDTFDLFCENIQKGNASILEIACGPGNITKCLSERRPDFKILGTDLAPAMLELVKANNPTAIFQLMDARDIDKIAEKFDGLMCGFLLPYLSKEEAIKLIQNASGLLYSNGIIYISTMEDDYDASGFEKASSGDEVYMYYHQADYLKQALETNNFEIILLDRKESLGKNGNLTRDLIIIARRK